MNMTLKAIYVCVTSANRWGKGYTITEAKTNAGIKARSKDQYYVTAAMYNDPTKAELDNLFACIVVNQISGNPGYYEDGRDAADSKMIDKLHVGWITVEKNYKG